MKTPSQIINNTETSESLIKIMQEKKVAITIDENGFLSFMQIFEQI